MIKIEDNSEKIDMINESDGKILLDDSISQEDLLLIIGRLNNLSYDVINIRQSIEIVRKNRKIINSDALILYEKLTIFLNFLELELGIERNNCNHCLEFVKVKNIKFKDNSDDILTIKLCSECFNEQFNLDWYEYQNQIIERDDKENE